MTARGFIVPVCCLVVIEPSAETYLVQTWKHCESDSLRRDCMETSGVMALVVWWTGSTGIAIGLSTELTAWKKYQLTQLPRTNIEIFKRKDKIFEITLHALHLV